MDGGTGFLTRPDSPASLRKAMMRLMEMPPDIRRAMGQLARERMSELFNLDGVLDRWEVLYRDLLKTNSHPRRLAGRTPSVILPAFGDS
jgi:glycosyltransferase involved in cell wall biosynthesis